MSLSSPVFSDIGSVSALLSFWTNQTGCYLRAESSAVVLKITKEKERAASFKFPLAGKKSILCAMLALIVASFF